MNSFKVYKVYVVFGGDREQRGMEVYLESNTRLCGVERYSAELSIVELRRVHLVIAPMDVLMQPCEVLLLPLAV